MLSMSAVDGPTLALGGGSTGGRPGYLRLLPGVLWGQILGSVGLWVLCVVLSFASLVGVGGVTWIYLPWSISGAWSLAAAVGWGTLVAALIAGAVRDGVRRRAADAPALLWTTIAVALAGYGSMALGSTAGARIALSVLLAPLTVRLLAFTADGRARPAPASPYLPRPRTLILLAVALAVPYSVTHPFAAQGSGVSGPGAGQGSDYRFAVGPGRPVSVDVGLSSARFAAHVTGVAPVGRTADVRTVAVAVTLDGASPASASTRLPSRVPAGSQPWISLSVALRRCPSAPATVTGVRLGYRMLGLELTQQVALEQPVELTCP